MSELNGPRYEIKFVFNRRDAIKVERWLLLKPSFSRVFPDRVVRSIYYDQVSLPAAAENLMGLANRTKIRARFYDDWQNKNSKVTLEAKIRRGRYGYKTRVPIHVQPSLLFNTSAKQGKEIFKLLEPIVPFYRNNAELLPTLFVCYRRSYYQGTEGIRLTVDKKIEFFDLLRGGDPSASRRKNFEKDILEFKFPPKAKDQASELMSNLSSYPMRSSKYLTGLSLFGHVTYT